MRALFVALRVRAPKNDVLGFLMEARLGIILFLHGFLDLGLKIFFDLEACGLGSEVISAA